MTAVRAHRWASSTALAALLVSVLAALLSATPTYARLDPVELSFAQLLPGEERSRSVELSLPRDATLTDVVVSERTGHVGSFAWDVQLCRTGGECVPIEAMSEGAQLAAGSHTLDVTVRLEPDAPAGAGSALNGHVAFAETLDGLAVTGLGPGLLVLAALLLLVGAVLVAIARRHSGEGSVDA